MIGKVTEIYDEGSTIKMVSIGGEYVSIPKSRLKLKYTSAMCFLYDEFERGQAPNQVEDDCYELNYLTITTPALGSNLLLANLLITYLQITSGGGAGTVTSVSVVPANGFAGTVATATTTPAITLTTTITGVLHGNGTAISAASVTGSQTSGVDVVVLQVSPTITNLNLTAGTITVAPLKFNSGPLKTSGQAIGDFEFLTDKIYFTISTGTARKEITLNDIALTSGRVPYTTTNGRLSDNANLTWDNTNGTQAINAVGTAAALRLLRDTGSTAYGNPYLKIGSVNDYALNGVQTIAFGYVSAEAGGQFRPGEFGFITTNGGGATLGSFVWALRSTTSGSTRPSESMRLTDSNYLGVNIVPTATFHGKGTGTTSATYTGKLENSAGTNLVKFRDDGTMFLGQATTYADNSATQADLYVNGVAIIQTKYLAANIAAVGIGTNAGVGGAVLNIGGRTHLVPSLAPYTDTIAFVNHNLANTETAWLLVNGRAGFGLPTAGAPNAKVCIVAEAGNTYGVYAKGPGTSNSTASIYGINSSDAITLAVYDNGTIAAPLLQTGNAGLNSGDLYVDTAANILANGDVLVGRKV
jgi:hypothetical protein